jgi:hypothetical protein
VHCRFRARAASRLLRVRCGWPTRWIRPSPSSTRRPARLRPPSASVTGRAASSRPRDGVWVSDRVRRHAGPHRPADRAGRPHGSPGKLAAGPGGGRVRRMGRRAAVPSGQPPRRHLDRRERYCRLTDPTLAYDRIDGALATVYDGLTAFRRSGGAAGLTLVPDLAKTLPRPPTAARRTRSRSAGESVTPTAIWCGRPTSGAASSASSATAPADPDYYEGIPGDQRAASTRDGAICPPGSSPMTRRARSPSAWSRRTRLPVQARAALVVPAPPGTPEPLIDRAPFLPGYRPRTCSRNSGPHKSDDPRAHPVLPAVVIRRAQPAEVPVRHPDEQWKDLSRLESAVIARRGDLADLILSGRFGPPRPVQVPSRRSTSALKRG